VPAERFRCAAASLGRGEALVGTASRVGSWVLVEQPGAWGADALLESGLDPAVGRALAERARATGTRVLLVRSPDRSRPDGARRCFLAHTGARSSWIEALQLADPADLLRLDWGRLTSATPPGLGAPHAGTLCLVCTHGRHDACCADLGRPLVRALVEARVDDVWESSHLGGDRFAGNLVSLPDGSYFGRVEPGDAVDLVARLRRGELRLDGYRGRSCFAPRVQAAERFAREATGVTEVHGLWPSAVERLDGDRLRVVFALRGGGGVRVVVAREAAAAAALTCSATVDSAVWSHLLESVEPLAGGVPTAGA
jgi:hypothetical protein